jgi:ferrochelatase
MSVEDCCNKSSEAHAVCYRHQVFRTTEALTERLGIPKNQYTLSFQSRLGKDAWLKPFTVDTVQTLAQRGVKRLLVMCPAFVSDCLETLEEIGMGIRDDFLAAGGESFELVPCLNDNTRWIDVLEQYCTAGLGLSGAERRPDSVPKA